MYKLVAIDCDNTLLDSTANIPERNKIAIRKLQDKGINFILATGRNDILVKDYVKELGISAPVIGCNGASIRNFNTDEFIKFTPIEDDTLKAVFDYCSQNKIDIKAFSLTHRYANEDIVNSNNLSYIIKTYTRVLSEEMIYQYVEDMHTLIGQTKLLKLVVVNYDEDFIDKIRFELRKIDGIEVVRSNKFCVDIMHKGITKGSAVKSYAEMLGIKPQEVVAFGDSENDLSMLKYAGFSVAMENGEKCLKDVANMVTGSNDDGGVGMALEKIFSI